jgi:hypothetical protein
MKREVLLLVVGLCAGVIGVAAIRAWQHGGARVATVAGTTRAVPGPQAPVTTSGEGPLDPAILADVYGIHVIAQASFAAASARPDVLAPGRADELVRLIPYHAASVASRNGRTTATNASGAAKWTMCA